MTVDEPLPDAASLRGSILRAWRENAGLSGAELARRIPCTPSALSNWEHGRRFCTPHDIQTISENLDLEPMEAAAFRDMCRFAASITDGMPRHSWAHNFTGPSMPVWIWVRPGPDSVNLHGTAWWGEPFQGTIDEVGRQVGPAGIVIHAPVSLNNPPLRITLRDAGWVDFGTGILPQDVADRLAIRLCDYRLITHKALETGAAPLVHEDERALIPLIGHLRAWGDKIGTGWHLLAPHIKMVRSHRPPHALDGTTLTPPPWASTEVVDYEKALVMTVSTKQLRQLREARGHTRESAARAATDLDPTNAITPRVIELLEQQGGIPSSPFLLSRLDMIYGADGRLAVQQLFDSRDLHRGQDRHGWLDVPFLQYWVGPVWIRAISPEKTAGLVELVWGPWRRKQYVNSGSVLTTRRASVNNESLRIRVPPGWFVTAGLGASPTALDINEGWWPVNIRAAKKLLIDNLNDMWRTPTK